MSYITELIAEIYTNKYDFDELRKFLSHGNVYVKLNTMMVLSKKFKENKSYSKTPGLVQEIQAIAENERLQQLYTVGSFTVAEAALVCLFNLDTPESLEIAHRVITDLKSRDISIKDVASNRDLAHWFADGWRT